MIQPQELRIGNIINIKSKYKRYNELFIEVESINSTEINTYFRPYELNHCIGIPLTEEILLKCGFIKDEESDNGFFLKVNNDWSDIYIDVVYGYCEIVVNKHSLPIPLLYVHQLQNLIFSLTQKELTIQL